MNLPNHEVLRGCAVYAYDQRGWGRSPGRRGYVHVWSENLDDLDAFLRFVHAKEPGCPTFLMGHTGSAPIVIEYDLEHPQGLQGVFCVSPALNLSAIPPILRMLANTLSRVLPYITIDAKRQVDAGLAYVSHDPAFVEFARADPLRNTKLTIRFIAELGAAVERVNAQATHLRSPLLILCGGADRTIPPETTKAFFEKVSVRDKEFHEYPDAYTNLLSDTVYEEVLSDVDKWIDRHL
jgi:alpha-beta hydrolase superfamily lysophospholipase